MKARHSNLVKLFIAMAVGVAANATAWAGGNIPAAPEPGTFKIGVEPWLGYGQWYVAQDKGLFKKNGLEDVQIVNFTADKDINAALASGQLDAANIATHTAMVMVAAGLPVKIVQVLDVSMTADAIVAGKDINTVADLKGKQVAYEEGTTSDLLLNYALAANGMTIADVQPVPMPAADAGSALLAGQVPVAVTYEPYLTTAMNQDSSVKLLFPASKDPGLISDVFVVREDVLKSRPGQVLAMVKAWNDAVQAYNADVPGGRTIISKAIGANPDELNTAFDGVKYYSLEENKAQLTGDYTKKIFADVEEAAKNAKLLTSDVKAEDMIDPSFVDAAH